MFGWGACFAAERCANIDLLLLPYMVAFTFPAGLIAALIISPWVPSDSPWAFTLLCLAMSIAGYAQWSMILANVGRPQVLTLGLNETGEEVGTPLNLTEQPSLPKKRRNQIRRIQAFDRQGLTPLQRALRNKQL
jgi:hypothetical protein